MKINNDVMSLLMLLPEILTMMTEKARLLFLGMIAATIGRGGITAISKVTGTSRTTITKGRDAWNAGERYTVGDRDRRPGAGRPKAEDTINRHLGELSEATIKERCGAIMGRRMEDATSMLEIPVDAQPEMGEGESEGTDADAGADTNAEEDNPSAGTETGTSTPKSQMPHSSILVFPSGVGVHDVQKSRAEKRAEKKGQSAPVIMLTERTKQEMYLSSAPALRLQDGISFLLPAGVNVNLPLARTTVPVKKNTGAQMPENTGVKHHLILPTRVQIELYGVESLPTKRFLLAPESVKAMRAYRMTLSATQRRHMAALWDMEDEYASLQVSGSQGNSRKHLYVPGLHRAAVKYTGIYVVVGGYARRTEVAKKPHAKKGKLGNAKGKSHYRQTQRKRINQIVSYTNANQFPPNFNFRAIKDIIELIVINDVYGDPMTGRMYTKLSTKQFCEFVRDLTGDVISAATILSLLRKWGISLHCNKKLEQVGEKHCQTDEQMEHIHFLTEYFLERDWNVVSIDSKAKIKLGDFATAGKEWALQGFGRECPDHDWALTYWDIYKDTSQYIPKELLHEKAICTPFCVYCLNNNKAHVSLGISKDTSEFAGKALRDWWDRSPDRHSHTPILILMDGGGSNRCRGIDWKAELAKFADYTGAPIYACHYPVGKSKFNPCERKVWGAVSRLWAAHPLSNLEIVQEYFLRLGESYGLETTCEIDSTVYKTKAQKKQDYREAKSSGQKVKLSDYVPDPKHFFGTTFVDYPIHNYLYDKDAMTMWNYIVCPHDPISAERRAA